jgi:hypothetical protein
MTIRFGLCLIVPLIFLTGCVSPIPPLDTARFSPLQVRAMETRSYEDHDAKMTLTAVLNVLQDEGFIVDYGNADLGLLHATKTIGQTADRQAAPAIAAWGRDGNISPGFFSNIEATANVSNSGNQVKVRVNFQRRVTDLRGWTVSATPVSDPKSYQEFFAKLDRGLFIQKQGL